MSWPKRSLWTSCWDSLTLFSSRFVLNEVWFSNPSIHSSKSKNGRPIISWLSGYPSSSPWSSTDISWSFYPRICSYFSSSLFALIPWSNVSIWILPMGYSLCFWLNLPSLSSIFVFWASSSPSFDNSSLISLMFVYYSWLSFSVNYEIFNVYLPSFCVLSLGR